MAVSRMHNASGHNYRNSSFIVDVAMGQIPRSTERISSCPLMFVSWMLSDQAVPCVSANFMSMPLI